MTTPDAPSTTSDPAPTPDSGTPTAAAVASDASAPAQTADSTPSDGSTVALPVPVDLGTTAALGAALVATPDPTSVRRRWGVVTAINSNGTCDVRIDTNVVPGLQCQATYIPTIGETVILDVVGTDTSVVGATNPSPRQWNRPTGDIEPSIRKTAKPDTLILNGQLVSRTTYANLWAWAQAQTLVMAGMFTVGDGSTTFGLPDFRGKVPIGVGTLGSDTYALGDTQGTARPTIAVANLPSHNHSVGVTIADHPSHNHSISVADHGNHGHSTSDGSGTTTHDYGHTGHFPGSSTLVPGGTTYGMAAWNSPGNFNSPHTHDVQVNVNVVAASAGSHSVSQTTLPAQTHTPTVTQSNIGSGTAFDVRQPSLAINWLIWV